MVAELVECGLQWCVLLVKCVVFSVCVNHKEQESISPESVRKACEFCRLHVRGVRGHFVFIYRPAGLGVCGHFCGVCVPIVSGIISDNYQCK